LLGVAGERAESRGESRLKRSRLLDTAKHIDLSEFRCRKCDSQSIGRNGAQIRNGTRFQRLICRTCKYIRIEYSLPLPDKESVVLGPKESTVAAQALTPVRDKPVPASPSEIESPRLENPRINPVDAEKTMEGQHVNIPQAQAPSWSANSNKPMSTNTAMATTPFRRLELEVPTDWSATGVLAYTQHAQQALQQALAQFEHPAMAELELQRLEPRVREYVRARQAFDTALMLQWAAVFTGPTASLNTTYGTHLEHSQVQPREGSSGARDSSASSLGGRDQLSNDDPDDPEHSNQTDLLQQLEMFKRQERAWRTDRLRLKQELQLLELDKQRVVTNWTRVKQHYEGLKSHLRNGEANGQGISLAALPVVSESTRQALPRPSVQEFSKTMTTSLRIAPPTLSTSEQAKIERLSNSLIANLIRLEGYCIRPRDIAHVTGTKGPWKTVLEHLFNLGQIERAGEFITLSLVERLRRHLPAVTLEVSTNRRKS
jgi:hypothetical protein